MNLIASLIISLSFAFSPPPSLPLMEDSVLVLFVTDTEDRPITNITITCTGDCSQARSVQGKVRIKLPPQTSPGESTSLQIVKLGRDPDWVLISPWNNQVIVPSFKNKAGNAIQVVVGRRGDKQILSSGKALQAMTAKLVSNVSVKIDKRIADMEKQISSDQHKSTLQQLAETIGFTPEEIDQAIREWGRRAKDPYEKGLAALYTENYSESSKLFSESVRIRKDSFNKAQNEYASSLYFLGRSLLKEKKYDEAIKSFEKWVEVDIGDTLGHFVVIGDLTKDKRYSDAERIIKKRLELANSTKDIFSIHSSFSHLLRVYKDQKRYDEAERIAIKSLEFAESIKNVDFIDQSLRELNNFYYDQRRYDDAERIAKKRLDFAESTKNFHSVYRSLGDLAFIYEAQERYDDAEVMYKKSLGVAESLKDDMLVSHTLFNLSYFYTYKKKQYVDAERIIKKKLELHEKDKNVSNKVTALHNLIYVYVKQMRFDEAESWYVRLLGTVSNCVDDCKFISSGLAERLKPIAFNYAKSNHLEKAESMYKELLKLQEQLFGSNSIELTSTIKDLADMNYDMKRYDIAEALHKRNIDIYKLTKPELGFGDSVLLNLGRFYRDRNRYQESESILKERLELYESKNGQDHVYNVQPMLDLAITYRESGKYSESESLYNRLLCIAETQLKKDTYWMGNAVFGLGRLYVKTEMYTDAERIYKQAIPILEKMEFPKGVIVDALTEYINLLGKLNRPDEAKEYDLKLQKLKDAKKDM